MGLKYTTGGQLGGVAALECDVLLLPLKDGGGEGGGGKQLGGRGQDVTTRGSGAATHLQESRSIPCMK